MSSTRLLLSCVNSSVSLIGFDLGLGQPFWYCPANVLRACGACYGLNALWVASDSTLTRLDREGCKTFVLPGPHENLAHSVVDLGNGLLGVADTGNSRLLLFDGSQIPFTLSPVEAWGEIGVDAIHLNDLLPCEDGFLVSCFSHEPFTHWKGTDYAWQKLGHGCIFHLSRHNHCTAARLVACGLNCPHSIRLHQNELYCCSSTDGDFIRFRREGAVFHEQSRRNITKTHFLRGALRLTSSWVLGGSSQRHFKDGGGMMLYQYHDTGEITEFSLGGPGEIYDILPWPPIMSAICDTLLRLPLLPEAEGVFPERCRLPDEYRD